jgi:FAD/FMN-containing dehydrogenase
MSPSPETIEQLIKIVGHSHAITTPSDMGPYITEWRGLWTGRTPLVLRPGSTDEVSRIMALASATGTSIVPQGGHTGLVGGGTPNEDNTEVVLSLSRLNRIREVDAEDFSITVEAGCTLQTVQDAARHVGLLFPLSLASEGSCQIGGNLASNAGGLNVLAYGNARDLCLGLEVVLADGRVWNGLRKLRKDNTGYDLKNLFIGSEGTLGVITAAVLKLFPSPKHVETALYAVASAEAAIALFKDLKTVSRNRLTACELIPDIGMDFTARHFGLRNPVAIRAPWYVLAEISDAPPGTSETVFETADVLDGVIAQSDQQRADFWALREKLSESQKPEGGSIKHDISVPVSRIAVFISEAMSELAIRFPGVRPVCFGHIGDGNLHFNVSQPVGADRQAFLDQWEALNDVVFALVKKHHGSISAEHGIGKLKLHRMTEIKSSVELDLMRSMKSVLDPHGILNPGRVLP